MRLKKALLVFLISTANLTYGQIKIGDNPQNINQSSVLELESTSRALVITRVNTSQMNAITPLQGAMVYNTSTQCIHYYNGSQWLNLCDALANSVNISLMDNGDGTYTFSDANNNLTEINNLNESLVVEDGSLILTDTSGNAISVELQNLSAQTFTTDATAPREFPSILITTDANGTNFNFEVGVIDGLSIQDGSIRQIDLAGASVGSVQLRDNSVGNLAIADNAVGSLEIINGSVQPIDLGPGNSNQILTTNGAGAVQWVDQTGLVSADEVTYNNAISNLTANNVQEALDEVTNNINTLTIGDILTQGNDAANQNIRNVTDPSLPQDAATKNYVDQAITAGTADGSETILNNGTNINITGTGTSGSPYVINNTFTEVDGSVTNEIQTISLNGNNLILSDGGGSVPLPSGADGVVSDINTAGNNLVVTGANGGFNGNVNLESLVDNAVSNNGFLTAEVDGSITNEIITASVLTGTTLTITEGGNDFDIDLTGLGGGGGDGVVSDISTAGNNLVVTGANGGFNGNVNLEPLVDNAVANNGFITVEVDGSITNEIITASNLIGTTLTITEGGNDFNIDLSGLGGGSQNLASVLTNGSSAGNSQINNLLDPTLPQDAATQNYVETRIATILATGGVDGVVTNAFLSGTEIDFIGSNGGFNGSIDLNPIFATDAELFASTADGSETIINPSATVTVAGVGTSADPYVLTSLSGADGSETIVNGSATVSVTGTGTGADPYVLTSADTSDGSETIINDSGTVTVAGSGTSADPYILTSLGGADGSETIVNGSATVSVTGTGTGADPYVLTSADTSDGSETIINDSGTVTVAGSGTTADPYILTSLGGADGSETIVNGSATVSVTGTGTGADPYVLTSADTSDGSETIINDSGTVTVAGSGTSADPYILTSLGGADGSETIVNGSATVSVTGTGTGADPYVLTSADTSDGSETIINDSGTVTVAGSGTSADPYILTSLGGADGSETIVNGSATVSVTGTGTGADPYVLTSADTSDGSETIINDSGTVTVAGSGTTADPYILTSLGGADGSETIVNGSATVSVTGTGTGADPYVLTSADTSDGSETIINDSGTVTVAGSGTTADPYILTSLGGADGSETIVNGSATVSVTGTGTGADPYVLTSADTSDGSETIINDSGTVTVAGSGTSADPYILTSLGGADGSETIVNGSATVSVTGTGTGADPYVLTSADTSDGSETIINDSGTVTVAGSGTTADPYILTSLGGADGSETIVNGSATVSVTGTGTGADPYVLTSADTSDGSETIINDSGTVTVAGSGTSADPYILTSLGGADGSETIVNGSATVSVTGTGTGADPYVLTSADTSDGSETIINDSGTVTVAGSGTSGDPYILTSANFANTNLTLTATRTHQLGVNNLILEGSGNVGIGINPVEKLHVNGNILATGSITPDYVFQHYYEGKSILNPYYKMMSLSEIEKFTRSHNHLPGVPSAKEVKDKGGILVNRATEINLEKIEELFLHSIEQEKKIQDLKSENEILSKELNSLKNDLEEIKALLKKD